MRNLEQDCCNHCDFLNPSFSHIYVEEGVRNHERTKRILERFQEAEVIPVKHYKDVFCRKRQDVFWQNQATMMILAEKREPFLYQGAPVCQNFGEQYFYYTSCVMNCIYDCEYCYLKGMYPSGNLVVFVNLEDVFEELHQLLQKHEVYLCISYDTDLMALESITGFVAEWEGFLKSHRNLKIECRTKCGRTDLWKKLQPAERFVFAFTVSPDKVIKKYEHGTAMLSERLRCIREAMRMGFAVRLCFDPMIYLKGWKEEYQSVLQQAAEQLPMDRLYDVSVGSFRISQEYMKKLRKVMRTSAVVQYPFENDHGVYHYPAALMQEMEGFLVGELKKYLPEEKIFLWR